MNKHPLAFWSLSTTAMLQQLQAAKEGLTAGEAGKRLRRYGSNLLKPSKRSDVFTIVLMATSANFGNMFSMAGVSLLLPFLPLLPKQILLTNLLTDRQRGQGNGRLSPTLGHQSHSQVYDDLRSGEFGVRLPYFWCASAGFSFNSGSIQNRMVLGIGLFRVINCLGHTKP
jgi:Cation transporter/ATPase, N-terminus